ncbi:MAG: hypothetical protein LUE24_09350 [Lachnospiraceae bacterium]|nr:hypothetical protein [Lachnospiraceae bacterium]
MGDKVEVNKLTTKENMQRTVKDTVFRDLFSDPNYLIQLYRALHPEDAETTTADLKYVTLETVIATGIYNDLGFMVGNKLIILCESQSTWSENILFRSLMYLAKTYQGYFDDSGQNIYGSKKLQAPEAEVYVIYVGQKKIEKKVISLSEEFYSGKQTAVDVRVNVIVEGRENDIVSQYILFCKVVDSLVKEKGRSTATMREAIQICKDRNVLKEYLESHEKEAVEMLMELYDQERITDRMLASNRLDTLLEAIKRLMSRHDWSFEQAAEELGVFGSDRDNLRIRL